MTLTGDPHSYSDIAPADGVYRESHKLISPCSHSDNRVSHSSNCNIQEPGNGLLIIVFSMLLSPEISAGSAGDRDIGIRVDDLLIIVVFVAWLTHIALDKDWKGFVKTRLISLCFF